MDYKKYFSEINRNDLDELGKSMYDNINIITKGFTDFDGDEDDEVDEEDVKSTMEYFKTYLSASKEAEAEADDISSDVAKSLKKVKVADLPKDLAAQYKNIKELTSDFTDFSDGDVAEYADTLVLAIEKEKKGTAGAGASAPKEKKEKSEKPSSKKADEESDPLDDCKQILAAERKQKAEQNPPVKKKFITVLKETALRLFNKAGNKLKDDGEHDKIKKLKKYTENYVSQIKTLITGTDAGLTDFIDELQARTEKLTATKED